MAALVSIGTAGPSTAVPPNTGGTSTANVTGKADNGATLSGTFKAANFAINSAGQLVANGTLTGTLTDPAGAAQQVSQQVALPVDTAQSTGSCQILDLVLGPLDLDLLGLVVHLDTVHLNITAQQGPGNLLGNLLCAVAGLLNGPANNNALLNLLNQILGLLG